MKRFKNFFSLMLISNLFVFQVTLNALFTQKSAHQQLRYKYYLEKNYKLNNIQQELKPLGLYLDIRSGREYLEPNGKSYNILHLFFDKDNETTNFVRLADITTKKPLPSLISSPSLKDIKNIETLHNAQKNDKLLELIMGKYDFFPMTKKSHALNKESTKGTPTQIAFVDLEKLSPKVELDIKYATDNNFVKQKVYPCAKCYLVEPAALSLTEVAKELKEINLGLKVFDGLRPLSVQKKFWEVCPDERYVANPAKGSRHNRGMAVDLTLIDLDTKQELTMPSGYDDMSQRAHRSYEAMPSQEVKINCKLLELIMEKHNFVGFQTEWWHFDHKGWEQYPVLDLTFDQIAQQAIPVA